MDRKTRFNVGYLFLTFFAVMILREAWVQYTQVEEVPYSEFQHLLVEQKLADVTITQEHVRGKLKVPDGKKTQVIAVRVDPNLAKDLTQFNVPFSQVFENTFVKELMSWILPAVIFFALWAFLMRRMSKSGGLGGSFMSIGKSKAKVYVETDTQVTFKDVAGIEEAKEELNEIIEFLKDTKAYGRLGARIPKGILLVGPPGTGKTLLARAVAGEAGVPFFSISGSEFVEMFVGVGAARVRDLFEQARARAPCIIFIDELDALGRARGASPMSGGNDEKEQTLNQLLVEMDGFDPTVGLILLAATNRPEILDPALLRAGRFDRQVLVDRPDKKGRTEILAVHSKKIILAPGTELDQVAGLTPGFTGVDLVNLVNEAALVAIRRKAHDVTLADFTMAIERIVAGLERKSRLLNPEERRIVAFHEMGHTLVAGSLPHGDKVHKVSIIPRGIGALGYTIQRPTEDRYLMSKQELENKMTVLMGGRAAEKIIFNHLSTGAADDIARATEIARSMVTRYGMEARLGHVSYDTESPSLLGGSPGQINPFAHPNYSDDTAKQIDRAIGHLVNNAFERATRILTANETLLNEGALALLAQETLNETEITALFAKLQTFASESLS